MSKGFSTLFTFIASSSRINWFLIRKGTGRTQSFTGLFTFITFVFTVGSSIYRKRTMANNGHFTWFIGFFSTLTLGLYSP